MFVDTPGFGSLATRGAAETLRYLLRRDLRVVLIDAGSTTTPNDLKTIHTRYDAATPQTCCRARPICSLWMPPPHAIPGERSKLSSPHPQE